MWPSLAGWGENLGYHRLVGDHRLARWGENLGNTDSPVGWSDVPFDDEHLTWQARSGFSEKAMASKERAHGAVGGDRLIYLSEVLKTGCHSVVYALAPALQCHSPSQQVHQRRHSVLDTRFPSTLRRQPVRLSSLFSVREKGIPVFWENQSFTY